MEKKYDFSEIKILLESDNDIDLQEAREKTRDILTEMTSSIATIFLNRLELMWLIASSKRKSEAILQLDREYELISKFSEIAKNDWWNEKMVEMLIWLITAAWKEKQRQILWRDTVFVKENISKEELNNNLLDLTKDIAPFYNEYWDWFSSTKLAKEYELESIEDLIKTIENKGVAIDLWCANWTTSRLLSNKWFNKVIWFDISPDMLKEAEKSKISDKEVYRKANLFEWIQMGDNSVDLVVSDFWTASQIDIKLTEIDRVLKKWGKAYLSFYNKDYMNANWWQPWQWSLEPVKNPEDDILEVPLLNKDWNKSYKIYAKSNSIENIKQELEKSNLQLESISSHSLITAMMPPMFFDDENRVEQVKEYEKMHAKQEPYLGFYLTVVLSK